MVSMETDVEELLSLVVSTGSELDDQIVKLSQMGDLVRKGNSTTNQKVYCSIKIELSGIFLLIHILLQESNRRLRT